MTFVTSTQAGNVVTGEMVEELVLSGADIIKVGIGPGDCLFTYSSHCPVEYYVQDSYQS